MTILLVGVIVVIAAIKENRRQAHLIESGICEPVTEALYHPPPTYTCVNRNSSGICITQVPVYRAPYMRTLWRCEGERDFWRRSGT